MRPGFDNETYVDLQSKHIAERIARFGGKLYLEFGGKLFDDYHAARVLPGFLPDSKLKMLLQLKSEVEIVFAISADAVEMNKIRGDLGITYDQELLRLIDAFTSLGFHVGSVVVTRYNSQPAAEKFCAKLHSLGIRTYYHYDIPGYPSDLELIVSEAGYGKNDYIETTHPLVVVTAPGPASGKMATCLSQLYHEHKRGNNACYAKFETFPIWNLPLRHPVNLAYEAATADIDDVNMIDPFHLEAYGEQTVNYNRDVEVFPILTAMFEKILGFSPYKSPTDMGVNMAGFCITDEEICKRAAQQEIIRRYYGAHYDERKDPSNKAVVYKLELIMKTAGISCAERKCVSAALAKQEATGLPAAAIELENGEIVSGKTSDLLGPLAAALLNALKELAGIEHELHLVSPEAIGPIQTLKIDYLGGVNPRLHTDEVLIALSASASTDPEARLALEQLPKLIGCEVHSTVIPSSVDENMMKRLGMNLTCEPIYETKRIYHKA